TIVSVGPNPPPTACDALQPLQTQPINFAVLKERCRYAAVVTPAEVRTAQRLAFARLRLVVEPGGAAALAAALAGKVPVDGRTIIVLSGGNTDAAAFAEVLAGQD
ncbi:MAG: pyridoxal-5'-phosphate-dependent protein, partial [Sphingomonadales bacterium]|nr:pyridoxal-5'-phosphate-dependent protein [Sphingomonadales bacterium]